MTVGQIAGNYKVLEKIGEGGMGAVYKGVDVMLDREVAIKVLRPELAHQPDVVERFRSEAKLLARLNHPNIATLYSFQRQGEDLLMVMEFVPGEPLDAYLAHTGRMSPEQAVPLFCSALNGIEHAHTMGVVHRDIKPANVMLTRDASAKVMDFGIARALGAARMTRTGRLIGTLEYMAPEQVRGEAGDTRSDIYALGILLYEMLTGQVPFESDSDYGVMRAQIEAPPTSPRTLIPDLPHSLERAILTALEKEPDARFASVAAFREAVQAALGTHASPMVGAKTAVVPPPTRIASVPDQLLDATEPDTHPKATRAARSDEMLIAAASSEPKRTRVAGSQEAEQARTPKSTRLATLGDAVHAPERATGAPASFLARLGTKQYAGIAALLLVILIVVLAWPDGTPLPVDPNSEADPVVETTGNNEAGNNDLGITPTQRPLQPPPDQTSLQPDQVQPLVSTQELLDKAEDFFANNQLTTPAGENALDYARRVLMMDPINAEANLLIRRIADRYEGWGDERMQRGESEQALSFYERSLAVRPDNPNVTRKITDARNALGEPRQIVADEPDPEEPTIVPITPVVPERMTVSVSAGTPVRVRLAETIAAVNGDKAGDAVRFTVSDDVVVDGRVVIGRGAQAMGRVTHVRRAKTLRKGEVRFTIDSAKAVDGTTIQFQAQEIEVTADRGRDALVRQGTIYTVAVAQRAQVRTL